MRIPSKSTVELLNYAAKRAREEGHVSPTPTLVEIANSYGCVWDGTAFVPVEIDEPAVSMVKGGAR